MMLIMHKKHFTGIFLVLLCLSFNGNAQGLFSNSPVRGAGLLTESLPDNTNFSLEVGSGFTSFSSGTSVFGNFISPMLEYDVSPSFSIVAGGSFSFNQYSNLPQSLVVNSSGTPVQQGLTDHSLFLSGRYMINDNLFMTGSVYNEQGHIPLVMNQRMMDYSARGMTMGLEYKVSGNLRFGAEIGVNRSNNPYHLYSPFAGPFNSRHRGSPYRISPF